MIFTASPFFLNILIYIHNIKNLLKCIPINRTLNCWNLSNKEQHHQKIIINCRTNK